MRLDGTEAAGTLPAAPAAPRIVLAQAQTASPAGGPATAPKTIPLPAPDMVAVLKPVPFGAGFGLAAYELPDGAAFDAIRVVEIDGRLVLALLQPDGKVLVLEGTGPVPGSTTEFEVPNLIVGDVEVSREALQAAFLDNGIQPAAGEQPVDSSGLNNDDPFPNIGPGLGIGGLLPPTELGFDRLTPREGGLALDDGLRLFAVPFVPPSFDGGDGGIGGGAVVLDQSAVPGGTGINGGVATRQIAVPIQAGSETAGAIFGSIAGLVGNTNGVAGTDIAWTRVNDTLIEGRVGETLAVRITIEGEPVPPGQTGTFMVTVTVLVGLPDPNPVGGPSDTTGLNLGQIEIALTGGPKPVTGTIDVNVLDDVPVLRADARVTGTVDEDALVPNANEDDGRPGENGITGVGDSITGSLSALVNVGADVTETGGAAFSLVTIPSGSPVILAGITSGGLQVVVVSDGSVLRGIVVDGEGTRDVFTLTVSPAGGYTFTLQGPLDHPPLDGLSGDNTENTVPLSLDLSGFVVASDADNDSVTLGEGSFLIRVLDDIPIQIGEGPITISVDESALTGPLSIGNPDGSPLRPGEVPGTGVVETTGSLSALVRTGADQIGAGAAFALLAGATQTLALTSKGDAIVAATDGNAIVGTAGGREVFRFTLEADGDFTFRLSDQIDHAPPVSGAFENGLTTPIDLSSFITFGDFDRDAVTFAAGTVVVAVQDDVPVAVPVGAYQATFTSVFEESGYFNTLGMTGDGGTTGTVPETVGSTASVTFDPLDAAAGRFTLDTGGNGSSTRVQIFVDNGDGVFDRNTDTAVGTDRPVSELTWEAIAVASGYGGSRVFLAFDDGGAGEDRDFNDLIVGVDVAPTGAPLVSGLVEEDGMSGASGQPGFPDGSTGNQDAGDGNAQDEASGATGSLQALFSVGADEDLTISLADSTAGASLPRLLSQGAEVLYTVSGNTLTGYVPLGEGGTREVFTLTVQSDGSWSFDLKDQLDHVPGSGENTALQTVGGGSVAGIDLSGMITGSDSDGDSVRGARGAFVITVQDDVPVALPPPSARLATFTTVYEESGFFNSLSIATAAGAGATVAETIGATATLPNDPADTTLGRFVLNNGNVGLQTNVQIYVDDGDGVFELGVDLPEGVAVPVSELTWQTLAAASENGTKSLFLAFDDGGNSDDRDFNDQIVRVDFTATPGALVTARVEEDGMSGPAGQPGFPDNSIGNQDAGDGNTQDEASGGSGSLGALFSVGADEALTFSLSPDVSGLPRLLSQGAEVQYSVSGNTLTAYVPLAGDATRVVFTLTVGADGAWSFDLRDQLDHVAGGGENAMLQTAGGAPVGGIDLSTLVRASDADGDPVSALPGTFVITVEDDVPVASLALVAGALLTIDETDGTAAAGEVDPVGGALGTRTVTLAGLVTEGGIGADEGGGAATRSYAFSVAGGPSGFRDSQSDQDIVLVRVNDTLVQGRVGTVAGALAFSISIDAGAGTLTLTQFRAVEQPNPDQPNEPTVGGLAAGALTLAVTATDADGDTTNASADIGFAIRFLDDAPSSFFMMDAIVANSAGTATGLYNGDFGADGLAGFTISAKTGIAGVQYSYADTDGDGFANKVMATGTGDGLPLFSVTVNKDGTYTLQLDRTRPEIETAVQVPTTSGNQPVSTLTSPDGNVTWDGLRYNATTNNFTNPNANNDRLNGTNNGFGVGNAIVQDNEGFKLISNNGLLGAVRFELGAYTGTPNTVSLYWVADGPSGTQTGTLNNVSVLPGTTPIVIDPLADFTSISIGFDFDQGGARVQNFSLAKPLIPADVMTVFDVDAHDGDGDVATASLVVTFSGNAPDVSDMLTGSGSDEVFFGGLGNDTIVSGNGGLDIVDYSAESSAGMTIALGAPFSTINVGGSGLAAGDRLTDVEGIIGGAGGDTLTGNTGSGNRANYLDGRGGSDSLSGLDGNDTLLGGDGNDTALGGTGDDSLSGGSGSDSLVGNAGLDILAGGDGADWLTGGNGDDILIGGLGADTVTGGAGADVFVLDTLDAKDLIADYGAGDRIDLSTLFEGPGNEADIGQYVKMTGGVLAVDVDGAANGASFVDVATVQAAGGGVPPAIQIVYEDHDHVVHAATINNG